MVSPSPVEGACREPVERSNPCVNRHQSLKSRQAPARAQDPPTRIALPMPPDPQAQAVISLCQESGDNPLLAEYKNILIEQEAAARAVTQGDTKVIVREYTISEPAVALLQCWGIDIPSMRAAAVNRLQHTLNQQLLDIVGRVQPISKGSPPAEQVALKYP